MKMTPQQWAEKWARRTSAAVQDYTAGVKAVSENPAEKAAAKEKEWAAAVAEAAAKKRFSDGLSGVTLQDWKDAAANKGAGRIASGASGAQNKMQDFAGYLNEALNAASAEVEKIPRGDLEANIQRSVTQQREMAKRPYKGQ